MLLKCSETPLKLRYRYCNSKFAQSLTIMIEFFKTKIYDKDRDVNILVLVLQDSSKLKFMIEILNVNINYSHS